jgi:ABC-type multidrug transport system fused ATPase/permease subunit
MTTVRRVWHLLTRPERRTGVALLALMIIGMALETLGIGLVIPTIALLTQRDPAANYPILRPIIEALGNPSQSQLVARGMVALIGIYLIKALFLAFLAWRLTKFAFGIHARLSLRLFSTYLRQPYTFHLQRNSAQLIRNAVTEVGQVTNNAITPTMVLITEGLVLIGIGSLLVFVEPVGAGIIVPVLGAAAWAFQQGTRARISRWGVARQHHEGLRIQHLQQGLGGAKDVKLMGREIDFLAQYGEHNTQSARIAQRHRTLQQLPPLWLELLAVLGLSGIVLTMLAKGDSVDSIMPTLGLFAVAAFRLLPSANRLLGAVQSFRYGAPALKTLHEELSLPASETSSRGKTPSAFESQLQLRGVTYMYPSAATHALKSLSITIRKGEMIGFIGPSGSGKSTLVDVILGLLPPTAGVVSVDGHDIQSRLRAWQDQIGYVPQSIYLTDDTLRRNVAFGLPQEQIDEAAITRAIRAAQLEEFVASLPAGLETMVGERGVRLSGGQRQRIGIARALYHDPAVLVLDEATSALDAATERGVMQAVTALHGSKTVLIVAHRLSTVQHCDRLYRLEEGRIVGEVAPQIVPQERVGT